MLADKHNKPILVLGAGVNGAAIARELALNGASVVVVDKADLCSGTTAYSSRLIHGGLRYLEHFELELVRVHDRFKQFPDDILAMQDRGLGHKTGEATDVRDEDQGRANTVSEVMEGGGGMDEARG